jgi:predicted RNA-binding Zn-ribbon protein involved in translation (DUF1610 family)/DNA-directed RNA polymerase subunit RPC12/RpoP
MVIGKKFGPVFKEPEKEFDIKLDNKVDAKLSAMLEKIKVDAETKAKLEIEKIRSELDSKTDEKIKIALQEKEEKTKKEKADRIAEAVSTAKTIAGGMGSGKEIDKIATVEQVKDNHTHDGISCPTCKGGHVHKVESDKSGLVYKCHGDKCGFEAVLVPMTADFKCNGCGAPIKKPDDPVKEKEMEGCPFCKSKKAFKFDWGKLWKVNEK